MSSTGERKNTVDRAAELRTWMELYGPGLRRYFRRRVSEAEAEELTQDVFLAMHARQSDEPLESVQGYLFTVAANLLRRRQRKPQDLAFLVDTETPDSESPERIVIYRQETIRVLSAIKALPPRCREAFVLHRFENMSYLAIARQMGISVSAVGKLIASALAHLARQLGPQP